ncbi:MAG: response regulator transcription factor [Bacilli bacterium]|nr:response regulator transcription factor [Bacilli bacterium]
MHILLVEDDLDISSNLKVFLESKDYLVTVSNTIKNAQANLKYTNYDLMILDITLPDGNGIEFYKKNNTIPTIFLSAKDDEETIVNGLELGAEDYLTKPFSSKELLARINRILLRNKKSEITIKDITFDYNSLIVKKNNEEIKLSSLELKILNLLFTNLNKIVTREMIIENIWNWTGNDVNDNTITVYLKRIREKLDTDIITTIKGIGYRINE